MNGPTIAWNEMVAEEKSKVDSIVEILKKHEHEISDGFAYWCGQSKVDEVLKSIAVEIVYSEAFKK